MRAPIQRRAFLTLLGTAAAWPMGAGAQQAAVPVVGYLDPRSPGGSENRLAAFRKGLSETGYVEGRNVAIEFRWGNDDSTRVPDLIADLVRRQVKVIVVAGSDPTVRAAKATTSTIPIVFATGNDPVQAGFVASLNRPGGNVTGVTSMAVEVGSKRLGLLHELLPRAGRIAVLASPSNPQAAEAAMKELQPAAAAINGHIEVFYASTNREIDTAFGSMMEKQAEALIVLPLVFFANRRVQIVNLASYHRLPTIYNQREFVEVGGLMSYGASIFERDRQVGIYAGRMLKGDKPADVPVMRPTKFDFVINIQMARTLGLEIPPTLLAIADEVIE